MTKKIMETINKMKASKLMPDGKAVLLYLFNAVALMPLLCFSFPHYTGDSYFIASDYSGHVSAFLGAFRYVGALIIQLWTKFFDPIADPFADAVVFILITALSVTALTRLILIKGKLKGSAALVAVDFSVLISVANFFLVNVLSFPECIHLATFGILICFTGVIVYFHENLKPWIRYIIAGILLISCTAVYQQFLTIFIIFAFLLSAIQLLSDSAATPKKALRTYFCLALFSAICVVIYYGAGIAVQRLLAIPRNPRASFGIGSFFEGILYYLTHQRGILGGKDYFKTPVLRRCFEILALLWGISAAIHIKTHGLKLKTALVLLTFPAAYFSSFLVGTISDPGGIRVILGLFSVFALFACSGLVLSEKRLLALCFAGLTVFVFSLNIYMDLQMFTRQAALNANELVLARQYLSEIDRYETETGKKIRVVAFCTDEETDAVLPVEFGKGDGSALTYDWGVEGIFRFVSGGRTISTRLCTEEEKSYYFGDKEWTVYAPEEQLRFENNTLFLCVY